MRPSKQELETKWWHRLIKASIWLVSGVATILFISAGYIVLVDSVYFEPIISFEEEYKNLNAPELSYDEIYEFTVKNQIVEKSKPKTNPKAPIVKLSEEDKNELVEEYREAKKGGGLPSELDWLIVKFIAQKDIPPRKIKLKKKYGNVWWPLSLVFLGPLIFLTLNLFYYKFFLYVVYGGPSVKN